MPAVMRGLHARDSEQSRAVLKFGQMLETPSILRYGPSRPVTPVRRGRDNATGAANQQERLDAYRAGPRRQVSITSGPVLSSKLKVRLANH